MKRLALLLALLGAPAQAQTIPEFPEAPASVIYDLETLGVLDGIRLWALDLNGDGWADLLTQTAFGGGGNSVFLRNFVYYGTGDGLGREPAFVRGPELEISDPIRSVTLTRRSIELDLYTYQSGDARCCPTGSRLLSIPR